MAEYRSDLPPLPDYMRKLPLDERGYPVPGFVSWLDEDGTVMPPGEGTPDFRVVNPVFLLRCKDENRCWLCGQKMGGFKTFVIGPMCSINRISAEPPSHRTCAEYAVTACPFMLRPKAKRREANLPHNDGMAGFGITRNPGVMLVWTTRGYKSLRSPGGGAGWLFQLGDPTDLSWWREGREATPEEIHESIDSGLPLLREKAEEQGSAAVAALERQYEKATPLIPVA